MTIPETLNVNYIDSQYRRWKADPASVSRDWRYFFEGFDLAADQAPDVSAACSEEQALRQSRVDALIFGYRHLGHLLACMDPLTSCPTSHPLLDLEAFGLESGDLDSEFIAPASIAAERISLKEILQKMKETYCRSIGVEYMHIQDPEERRWLQQRMEPVGNRPGLEPEQKRRILSKLTESAVFEQFLNKKYVAVTRFSLEGADVVVPVIDAIADRLAGAGGRELILAMAHRGRLNVQAHILEKPYEEIFSEFESCYDPDQLVGSGDVKYHQGYLADVVTASENPIRMFLLNNPSHLEAVAPVAEGFCRARQEMAGDTERRRVVPLLVHGDAAFAGQGVVAETLNMSQLTGYTTGGTVHLVINNQIGYTTLPEDARSTRYATDVAKMLMAPVFHVHGEDPEAAVWVAALAADYRSEFGKDVVIDAVCYRRYGHNEGDEPYFTQPQMVERIRERPSPHKLYAETLLSSETVSREELQAMENDVAKRLEAAFDEIRGSACPFPENRFYEQWQDYHGRYEEPGSDTGVSKERLIDLARSLNAVPSGFNLFKKVKGVLDKRLEAVEKTDQIDWAGAEALAFASMLTEGHPVRLSGQDSQRGTFSQRHSVLTDTRSGERHTPLNNLAEDQAPFMVFNSLLAEYSVMGFDYGYALARPDALTLWEAQFGDFVNNAQSMIDLFIASAESKWGRLSNFGLLLPHGWEGLGPEHSSARLERFLQLCADNNMIVCNPSTPAQYFHLLRRQVKAPWRKPMVVMTPKSLLRNPMAVSGVAELTKGQFQTVIADLEKISSPKRVLLCSGKIFYELLKRRQEIEEKVAIVRIEQFYPFPEDRLKEVRSAYSKAGKWCWVQEEPENMGAWQFLRHRLEAVLKTPPAYIGRPAASSPATGFPAIYRRQQAAISEEAVGPAPDKS
jgi:2-oxoglutarate dehydrogenase E1 component